MDQVCSLLCTDLIRCRGHGHEPLILGLVVCVQKWLTDQNSPRCARAASWPTKDVRTCENWDALLNICKFNPKLTRNVTLTGQWGAYCFLLCISWVSEGNTQLRESRQKSGWSGFVWGVKTPLEKRLALELSADVLRARPSLRCAHRSDDDDDDESAVQQHG